MKYSKKAEIILHSLETKVMFASFTKRNSSKVLFSISLVDIAKQHRMYALLTEKCH